MADPAPKFRQVPLTPSQTTSRQFDTATVMGLVLGFTLIFTAIMLGGSIWSFFDLPSILIVFGGTFAATTICFSFPEIMRAQKAFARTLFHNKVDPRASALRVLKLSEEVRGKGPRFFETLFTKFKDEPILLRGVNMIADIQTPEEISRILHQESAAIEASEYQSAHVLQKAAEYAPAMGLIGTLVGLVHMLGNLSDPGTIGPSMALAILTTFYGALLANLVFSPLAAKLLRNTQEQALANKIFCTGILSIARHENPRILETQLNSILPPEKRINYYKN